MSGSLGGPSALNRGGTLFFKINGQQYDLAGTFGITKGGIVRKAAVGPDGVHGFTGKYMAGKISAELQDGSSVLMGVLQSLVNVTLTAELSNGKTYVLMNAFQSGEITEDTVEAKIKCDFEGVFDTELTS